MSEQTESASNHDTLCPARNRPAAWEPEMCVCDIITEVEERALRRGEASDHDPLCPTPECDFGDKGGLGDCAGWGDCHHDCRCRFIAKVRADERETAARRVSKVKIFALHSKTTPEIWTQLVPLDAAMAAARGESP